MKILHINTYDRGGAANACLRLHEGLLNFGINSKVLVLHKTNNNFPEVYTYKQFNRKTFFLFFNKNIQRIMRKCGLHKIQIFKKEREILQELRPEGMEMISFITNANDITDNELFREADIIHLHWIADFLDYKAFFSKCKKPIVWTFHDQNPFLGVEHFAELFLGPDDNGEAIIRQCTAYEAKIEKKYKQIKSYIFKDLSINIIVLSNWMKNEVLSSQMFPLAKINFIPNGIDSNHFGILDKMFCRKLLNLPLNKKIILFVSDNINNNRKGLNYLLRTIEKIKSNDFVLCTVGGSKSNLKNENFIELGKIHDQRLMNVAYSASDLFAIPSLMDNLPNTAIEALLSGIPIISFPVGGMLDMIIHKKNGYIAKKISVDALTNSINDFFWHGVELSADEIRKDAIKRYDISVQIKNMLWLYKDIHIIVKEGK